jgi:hypothetical protein
MLWFLPSLVVIAVLIPLRAAIRRAEAQARTRPAVVEVREPRSITGRK